MESFVTTSLVCSSKSAIFTWEPDHCKLLMRPILQHSFLEERQKDLNLGDEIELVLTLLPPFKISELSLHCSENLLFLGGTAGVVVSNLPVDLDEKLDSDVDSIICSSYILDKSVYSSALRVRQVKWLHPVDSTKCYSKSSLIIIILLSNGTLRIYNLENSINEAMLELQVGDSGRSRFDCALGDCVSSFDSFLASDKSFSIACLSQNGDVYLFQNLLIENIFLSDYVLLGPLSILPEVDDNYGDNFVKIACISSYIRANVYCFALFNANGDILHCLLLPDEASELSSAPVVQVLERVQMQQSSQDDLVEQVDDLVDFSHYIDVFVFLDIPFPNIYYFSNTFGASVVNAKCFNLLHADLAKDGSHASQVNRLVSTLNHSANPKNADNDQLLAGLIFIPMHNTIVCTSHAQSAFILKIEDFLLGPGSEVGPLLNKSLEIAKDPRGTSVGQQPFLPYIQKILAESKKVPKMSLGSTPGDAEEIHEMAKKVISELRTRRLNILSAVNDQLQKRVALITEKLALQNKEILEMSERKASLINQTRGLAEKYESLNSNQEVLESLADNISRSVHSRCKVQSKSEEQFAKQLQEIEHNLQIKRDLISSLKLSRIMQNKANSPSSSAKDGDESLSSVQGSRSPLKRENLMKHSIVQKLIAQEAVLINDLVAQINSLKCCF